MSGRVYLDWNATAPLRPEARAAMLRAMDATGNPSSAHAGGREARAVVERAREQVARLIGCDREQVIFTSGATEAAMLAEPEGPACASALEHDCVFNVYARDGVRGFAVDADGRATPTDAAGALALTVAQSETGVVQDIAAAAARGPLLADAAQAAGRIPFDFAASGAAFALVSAHKLGGPQGAGALISRSGQVGAGWSARAPRATHERGRRAGTENVIGVAGFGAAAEAALRDLHAGVWDGVRTLRDQLQDRLAAAAPDAIIIGANAPRLPNTFCVSVPGWRGETQVMAMDLAGFAVSAGSACSSGKTGPSRALRAMGLDDTTAGGAIRVSLGPTTTEDEIARFADAWSRAHRTRRTAA